MSAAETVTVVEQSCKVEIAGLETRIEASGLPIMTSIAFEPALPEDVTATLVIDGTELEFSAAFADAPKSSAAKTICNLDAHRAGTFVDLYAKDAVVLRLSSLPPHPTTATLLGLNVEKEKEGERVLVFTMHA